MSWIDSFLDKTVIFSYDRSGFLRHQKTFDDEDLKRAASRTTLITGGNSGIGLAAAKEIASFGHPVHIISRNSVKASEAKGEIQGTVHTHMLDLGELKGVADFVRRDEVPIFDTVICNAGSMPRTKKWTSEGKELVFASQVLGHFTLIFHLIEAGKLLSGSRVIFVSSAGIYTSKFDITDIDWLLRRYNPYKAYANAKRAQVLLNEHFSKNMPSIFFAAMHPGWVDTPGLERRMPWFYRTLKTRLRTPKQGADTIVFLALTKKELPSGKFWFDRKIRSPHLTESIETRNQLWDYCLHADESYS